ncbi:MAG: hypothetical protein V7459_05965 [Oceanicoccus sp.]
MTVTKDHQPIPCRDSLEQLLPMSTNSIVGIGLSVFPFDVVGRWFSISENNVSG